MNWRLSHFSIAMQCINKNLHISAESTKSRYLYILNHYEAEKKKNQIRNLLWLHINHKSSCSLIFNRTNGFFIIIIVLLQIAMKSCGIVWEHATWIPECNRKCREWSQSSPPRKTRVSWISWLIFAFQIPLNQHQIMKSTVSGLLQMCKQHIHTRHFRALQCADILLIRIFHSFACETNKQCKSEWIAHAMIHISNRHNLKCIAKVLLAYEKSGP